MMRRLWRWATAPVRWAARGVRRAGKVVWAACPDFRDLHVYGGCLLAAVGAGLFHLGAGLLLFGAGIAAIGMGLHLRGGSA